MAGTPRFLTLAEVAEILSTSVPQVYALVRRGELTGVKIGGRGQWRVETTKLEAYIAQLYVETEKYVAEHPFAETEAEAAGLDAD
jgi:excisionase family DNA binding protein